MNPNDTHHSQAPRAGPTRSLATLLTLLLIAAPLLAPSAAAENTTSKTVCFAGDAADSADPEPAGLYCATGTMETFVTCSGSGPSYECTVHAQGTIEARGPQHCAMIDSNATNPTNDPLQRASVCVTLSDTLNGQATRTATTGSETTTYDHTEIGDEGRTVWYNVEVCSWIDRTDPADEVVRCEEHRHYEYLPPNPASSGLTGLVDELDGRVDHARAVAENTEPPVSLGE